MAMFSGKALGISIGALILLGLMTGYVHYNTDPMKCFASKHWSFGEWGTTFSIGRFELRNRGINYDCDPDKKYNTKTEEIKNDGVYTEIVPKAH